MKRHTHGPCQLSFASSLPHAQAPCAASRRGFTLIELLVVIAILGVVGGVIAACLAGGIRAWDSARRFNVREIEAMTGLEIVEKDLMNAFRFYAISFNGKADRIRFPGLIEDRYSDVKSSRTLSENPQGSGRKRIGTVQYIFDRNRHALLRKTWPYPEEEPFADTHFEKILSHLNNMSLQYYALPNEDAEAGSWQDQWNDETNFPGGVRIKLVFKNQDDHEFFRLSRVVRLPVHNQ